MRPLFGAAALPSEGGSSTSTRVSLGSTARWRAPVPRVPLWSRPECASAPRPRHSRSAFAQVRVEMHAPGDFSAEALEEARGGSIGSARVGHRPHGPAVHHHRPAGLDGPRPGDVPRAAAARLSRPLRDRRPRVVHHAGRRARRGGAARGQTIYCPDVRVPLHPEVLSQGAASLLEGQERPAIVWRLDLAKDGSLSGTDVRRRPGPQPRPPRLRHGAGGARRRQHGRRVRPAARDRPAPSGAGTCPRRCLAQRPRAGGRGRRGTGGRWSTARPCPSRTGTRRSPC